MANIFNCRAMFSKIWKQQKAEAKAFRNRSLKLWNIMDCLNQQNLEKVKEAISLSVYQRNILVILQIKLFRLEEIFQKLWLSQDNFYYCFCYQYISPLHSILKFLKVSFFASLSYKYMKNWYFHGQYKANSLVINKISYNIFDLRHMSKVAAHFQKKNKMFIYSLKQPNKESGKILKNETAEPYLEPCYISMMECFCENTTAKVFIIDV